MCEVYIMEDDNGNIIKTRKRIIKNDKGEVVVNSQGNAVVEYIDDNGNVINVSKYKNIKKTVQQLFPNSLNDLFNEHDSCDIFEVLDNEGKIIVKDNPEYYHCTSTKAIEDAFTIRNFSADKSMVYLEGRTDEKYFNKALEVFGYDVPFQFKWVGYIDDNGNEAHTGDKSVDKAFEFLVARNLPIKNFCLKDCDTKRERKSKNNVTILSIPPYENSKNIRKGIENALVLDGINIREVYKAKERISDYGEIKNIEEFDKMACCDAICGMRNEELKEIFQNLKTVIDELVDLYENN